MATTRNFVLGTAVTLRSAAQVLSPGHSMTAHIYCQDCAELDLLKAAVNGLPINIKHHDPSSELALLPDATSGMSPLSFQRVFAAEQLRVEGDRILYLDSDLLVRHSLDELWSTDLDGHAIGAVRDVHVPAVSSRGGVVGWRELRLDRRTPYFNAGLLLINQALWRENAYSARIVAHYQRNFDRIRYFDQDAMNAILAGRWRQLPLRWNVGSAAFDEHFAGWVDFDPSEVDCARVDPAIVHFTGVNPWDRSCDHPWVNEWRTILCASGWPDPTPWKIGTLARVWDRMRKAGRALRHG